MGYGPPVQVPMSLGTPRDAASPYNPGLPEIAPFPQIRAASLDAIRQGAKLPAMPAMVQVPQVQNARAREAAQFANEMGTAFAYSKAQKKIGKQRARGTERAKTKAAERSGKQDASTAKRRSSAMRRANARMALREARRLGLGPKLYKTARL